MTNDSEGELIDFDVIKEDWNEYILEDGTRLKIKDVIVNIIEEKAEKKNVLAAKVQSQKVMGVYAPKELHGESSSETYTKEELRSSVVKDDLKVVKTIRDDWNEYRLKDGRILKTKNVLVNVARTNKFDEGGMPIYIVDGTLIFKPISPKKR